MYVLEGLWCLLLALVLPTVILTTTAAAAAVTAAVAVVVEHKNNGVGQRKQVLNVEGMADLQAQVLSESKAFLLQSDRNGMTVCDAAPAPAPAPAPAAAAAAAAAVAAGGRYWPSFLLGSLVVVCG